MKINVFWWFFVANWTSKNQHAGLAMVSKAQFPPWILDEKSCYFRVFFVCFLSHCKTGVLIFSCYAQRRVLVTLMIKALNYAKPSQPSGGKMHHFELLFSSKMYGEREIILFQNRKNKIVFGPKIHRERIQNARFVFVFFFHHISCFFRKPYGDSSIQGAISAVDPPSFLMKIHGFWLLFDENWLPKIDTPVCKLNFSCQIWFFIIFHKNQWCLIVFRWKSMIFFISFFDEN